MNNRMMDTLKKTLVKSLEVVSATASNIAENTKQKVNLFNLENRRKEILEDFGMIAYELWQKGENFPDVLDKQLKELSLVDAELAEYKAQKAAALEAPAEEVPSTASENDEAEESNEQPADEA